MATFAATMVALGATSFIADYNDPNFSLEIPAAVRNIGTLFPTTPGSTLTGQASVVDGDTIEIHGQAVRLNGIDAPESSQLCISGEKQGYQCGQDAAFFLTAFLRVSTPIRCEFVEWDQYSRFVGDCFRADGVSVNAAMVRSGYALDWPKYSKGKYAAFQSAAKAERLGLWDGEFQLPWLYRDAVRAKQDTPAPSVPLSLFGAPKASTGAGCNIKGNISIDGGQRIYHVPGQKFYSRTKISPEHGERWFCSEDEARSAGWRRSKQ